MVQVVGAQVAEAVAAVADLSPSTGNRAGEEALAARIGQLRQALRGLRSELAAGGSGPADGGLGYE